MEPPFCFILLFYLDFRVLFKQKSFALLPIAAVEAILIKAYNSAAEKAKGNGVFFFFCRKDFGIGDFHGGIVAKAVINADYGIFKGYAAFPFASVHNRNYAFVLLCCGDGVFKKRHVYAADKCAYIED